MNGQVSEYELQRQKNIAENKKILASLGLDKFKVSAPAVTQWTSVNWQHVLHVPDIINNLMHGWKKSASRLS